MLDRLFQSDKGWYDEKTRRLRSAINEARDLQFNIVGGRWMLQKIKGRVRMEKKSNQLTEADLFGDGFGYHQGIDPYDHVVNPSRGSLANLKNNLP